MDKNQWQKASSYSIASDIETNMRRIIGNLMLSRHMSCLDNDAMNNLVFSNNSQMSRRPHQDRKKERKNIISIIESIH
jgi:hypothetical protein